MILSRFAPAPTGFLHLGHIVNALHVWGITRAAGGRVLLRIEDHDRQRSRDTFERAILDDLDWLGFIPDDPSTDDFRSGPCRGRQRDRQDVYESALARLRDSGALYACACTRKQLRATSGGNGTGREELRYSGRCAARQLEWTPDRGIRVRLPNTLEEFVDLRHGPQIQRPAQQCGDMLIRDRDGNWTYQFAVTVDDMVQGVNLVIRGDDLLPSTGRQVLLARMLGRLAPTAFLHHGLIMKSAAQKLSKADRDTSIRDMRAAGASVEQVIGRTMRAAAFSSADSAMPREMAEALVAERYDGAIELLKSGP
jgi:glutamyl-Q tRNA(Asp) synthetase